MDVRRVSPETLEIYRKIKQIKELTGSCVQDIHKILEMDAKEFIHIFAELSQLLQQFNTMHEQLVPRAEYMLEHRSETMRRLRKETFRLVK